MYLRRSVSCAIVAVALPALVYEHCQLFTEALASCINAGGDMISGTLSIVTDEFVWG